MSQESILIVSDEQESRALLAQALSSHDGAVLVAEGAARAIVALDEHQVAVVILDWPLAETQDEGQDGVGVLARHIRQSQPEASIIALLGRDDVALMDLASLDVDDCLVKPPLPDLVRVVRTGGHNRRLHPVRERAGRSLRCQGKGSRRPFQDRPSSPAAGDGSSGR